MASFAPAPAAPPALTPEQIRELNIYQTQDPVVADAVLQFHQSSTLVDRTRMSNVILTLFEWRIMRGDLETVQLLLDHGVHAEAQIVGFRGCLPISIACKYDQLAIVKLLVARGAQVNRDLSVDGISPLSIACSYGHFEIIKWLVENGAWVNGQEVLGVIPLRKAIRQGSLQVVRLLISAGAKITSTKNPRGSVWCIAVLEGKSCILECLVESRLADLTEDNRVKASVLEYATEEENMGILRYLLALKVFSRSDMNECLCTAAKLQNTEIVKLLMANEADVNESSKQGETPLFCAVQNSEADVTETLLVLGANVNMPASRNQYSAIHNMVIYRRLDLLKIVRRICGDVADFRAPNQRESNTPLQLATSGGDVDIVRFLLDVLSLDLEIDAENREGETSLTLAIQKGYLDVVRLLVSKGAMINHQSDGWEPGALFTAVALGHFHVV